MPPRPRGSRLKHSLRRRPSAGSLVGGSRASVARRPWLRAVRLATPPVRARRSRRPRRAREDRRLAAEVERARAGLESHGPAKRRALLAARARRVAGGRQRSSWRLAPREEHRRPAAARRPAAPMRSTTSRMAGRAEAPLLAPHIPRRAPSRSRVARSSSAVFYHRSELTSWRQVAGGSPLLFNVPLQVLRAWAHLLRGQ